MTFAVIHNIPSPYRIHLFNVLSAALSRRNIDLVVHFMAIGHRDRAHWTGEVEPKGWEMRFWADQGVSVRGHQWHLNPGLIRYLCKSRVDYLLIGGLWDSLTSLLTIAAGPAANKTIGWLEPNTMNRGFQKGLKAAVKRRLLNACDAVAVPGAEGLKFVDCLVGAHQLKTATLPNIVDEARFCPVPSVEMKASIRDGLKLPRRGPLALWNARMIPAKGIAEFIRCLNPAVVAPWTIAVVGDGPCEADIKMAISGSGLGDRIHLLHSRPYAAMPELYKAADLLLLPSLHDPNPLSVVEAMHSGLPLLVSNRIGNLPEALVPGVNGWAVDPSDCASVRAVVGQAFAASPETLAQMGKESSARARAFWGSERSVTRFLDHVL